MDDVWEGLQIKIYYVFMDDVMVFSNFLLATIVNLKNIFQRLRGIKLKIQRGMCQCLQKEVTFFEHIITPEGMKLNPGKIKAIWNYPILSEFYYKLCTNY